MQGVRACNFASARSRGIVGSFRWPQAAECERFVGEADVHRIRIRREMVGDCRDASSLHARSMRRAIFPRLAMDL